MKQVLANLAKILTPAENLISAPQKVYSTAMKDTAKLWSFLTDSLASIGQKQLLRKQIANALSVSCKLDSNGLYNAISALNDALVKDLNANAQK